MIAEVNIDNCFYKIFIFLGFETNKHWQIANFFHKVCVWQVFKPFKKSIVFVDFTNVFSLVKIIHFVLFHTKLHWYCLFLVFFYCLGFVLNGLSMMLKYEKNIGLHLQFFLFIFQNFNLTLCVTVHRYFCLSFHNSLRTISWVYLIVFF